MILLWQKFISWRRNKKEERAIEKARRYLEKMHPVKYSYQSNTFYYLKTSQKAKYKRYHFRRGFDESITYVVLSDEERKEVIKAFKEKKGDGYAYYDSVIFGHGGKLIQHRFRYINRHDTSLTFMTENGEIWGGSFEML